MIRKKPNIPIHLKYRLMTQRPSRNLTRASPLPRWRSRPFDLPKTGNGNESELPKISTESINHRESKRKEKFVTAIRPNICGTQQDLLVDYMYPIHSTHSTNMEWFHLLLFFLSYCPSSKPLMFPLRIIGKIKRIFIIIILLAPPR